MVVAGGWEEAKMGNCCLFQYYHLTISIFYRLYILILYFFLNGFCIVFVHLKSVQRKLVRDVSRAQIGVNEIYTVM